MSDESEIDKNIEKEKDLFTKYVEDFFVTLAKPSSNIETFEYIESPYDILKSQNQVYVCEVIENNGTFIIKYRVKNNVENVDILYPLLPFLLSKGYFKISFESDNNISNIETFFVLSLNKDSLTTKLNDYRVEKGVLFPSIEHSFMENLFLKKSIEYIEAKKTSIKKININRSTEIISNSSKDLVKPKSTSSSSSTVTTPINISLFIDSILNIKTSTATSKVTEGRPASTATSKVTEGRPASAATSKTTPSTALTIPIRNGVINPGNNCYLNALAQLLITIPEIRQTFSNSTEPKFITDNKGILEQYYTLQMFRTMFILSDDDIDLLKTKNSNKSFEELSKLYDQTILQNNQKKEKERNKFKQETLSQLYSESCSGSGKSCQDLNKLFNDDIELTYSLIQINLMENKDKKSLLKYLLNQIFKNIEGEYKNLSFEPLIFPLLLFENLGQQEVNEAFQIMENILNDNGTQKYFQELTINISTRQKDKEYDTIVKEKILFLGNDIKDGESISSLIKKYDDAEITSTIIFSEYVIFYIRRETFTNGSRGINSNRVVLTDVENNGQTYKPIGVIVRIGGVGGGHFYYVDLDTQTKYNDSFVSECNNCLNNQEVLSGCRMVLYKKQEKINYIDNPVFNNPVFNNQGFGVARVAEDTNIQSSTAASSTTALKKKLLNINKFKTKNPGGSNKFRVSRRKQKKHK